MTNPVPVTLFAKTTGCQQCTATKRHLDRQGTPYEIRYVDEDPEALDAVRLLGYNAVPVVVAGDMHWSGFRPDKLNALGRLHTIAADIAELDAAAEAYLSEVTVP
ncbi:glutaredoxin family protein [Rhodococcus rhodochrous]|uniref:glutaredoxin domain-containing protein n=1 Tax=Rhodococcus rhodochrous TaxID=1829 RepID=UPI0027E1283A|nr:glutaredoxin domain-containing protein [Rhodococcus rhodochrous]MCB8909014.1 glutaredoxin family protein [Rhodococcus rhodochrous]